MKSWILSVMAVSVIGTMILSLTEKTAQTTIVKMVVSLSLIITILNPIRSFSMNTVTFPLDKPDTDVYMKQVQSAAVSAAQEKLGEYLEAYALMHGYDCSVWVECEVQNDVFIPSHVTVSYSDDKDGVASVLTEKIIDEFGIKKENIVFMEGT